MAVRSRPLRTVPTLEGANDSPARGHAPPSDIACAPDPTALEDAIENSHDCIALIDMSYDVTYMNFSGICQMGLDGRSQLQQITWRQLWSRECIDLIEYSLESVRSGRACRIFVHRPGARGGMQWWDIAASPVFDRNGTPAHMFCVCRDITDVRMTKPVAVVPISQGHARAPAANGRELNAATERDVT